MKKFKIIHIVFSLLFVWLAVTAQGAVTGITLTTMYQFTTNNGANPCGAPVFGPDGNLYGTAFDGGSNGVGSIYRITTNSQLTILHNFSTNVWDGANPYAKLTVGQDGLLYGTTSQGGTNSIGTIFKITTNGVFTQLYSFGAKTNDLGYALDGKFPRATVIQGQNGNLYGVTLYGGDLDEGTVFECSTNGVFTSLHTFAGVGTNDDGAYPLYAPLVESADGVLYGTTGGGGTNDDGTVFQITENGTFATLFEFNGTNGYQPYSGLSFGTDGNLYGTTYYGTTSAGGTNQDGNLFKITTNGVLTVLIEFTGHNGYLPLGGLVADSNNNIYGTTYNGGSIGGGTVFILATNGVLTTLYSFTGSTDGGNPFDGVTRDAYGNLYGTTSYFGSHGAGTIFRLRDTAAPTVTITAPVANQHWSNDVFSVTGTAKDNIAVASVYYSLNYSTWTNPITANAWTNWTTQLTLTPGTNFLQAYAVDFSGNLSATSAVSFVYVLSAPLTVLTNGLGTISPNYNASLLQIGANYSMTATAASGFGFVNWTDGNGNILTNSATLKFMMASNLTFTANFVDVTKPTLTITSPTANQHWSNNVFTVTGTAKDNVGVSNVLYSLNSSGWSNATPANSWSNWTTQIALTPGTNKLLAYAVDGAGNLSTTSSVSFVYILSAPLTVLTNGNGTVSPSYNGSLLQIDANYSMTATAASGFGFVNWTDGNKNILTNSATLKFVMASNLTFTANFVDTTKPTLTVTSPTSLQRWSNEVFNVTGTAKDNVSVAQVYYSLNNLGWSNAVTANNWSNWSAQVILTPGTNFLQAYAVDGAGNTSTTNNTTFDFVVTNQLQVIAYGLGTISPNYSNSWLEVGRNYSMAATPASGFVFTNWTIATNQLEGRVTNNATVQFMMVSNLILQADFVDVTEPTLTITSPVAGQHMTNALAVFAGTAKDNWGCSGVWYQLNTGAWNLASSSNGYTNWSTTNALVLGTNIFKAYAVDLGGNFSTTNSISVLSTFTNAVAFQLSFPTSQPLNGNGLTFNLDVSAGLSGQIQASTNLVDWITLTNFIGTGTNMMFTDESATNYNLRFYRAVIP